MAQLVRLSCVTVHSHPGPHDMPTDAVTALYLNNQQLAAWPALPTPSA